MSFGGLRARVTLGLGAAVLVTAALALLAVQVRLRTILLEDDFKLRQSRLQLQGAYLRYFVNDVPKDVLALSRSPALDRLANGAPTGSPWGDYLTQQFFSLLSAKSNYVQARLVDAQAPGRELIRVERLSTGELRVVEAGELQAKGARRYVQSTLALDSGSVYLSAIELNREHGQVEEPWLPVIRAATPIRDREGRLVAMIVINVEVRQLLEQLREGGNLFVLDAEQVLLHPDRKQEFRVDRGLEKPSEVYLKLREMSNAKGNYAGPGLNGEQVLAVSGNFELGAGYRVTLMDIRARKDVLKSLSSVQRFVVLSGLGAMLVALLLAPWLAALLTRPWERVTEAVESFPEKGELDELIQVPGEVGELARAFQSMSQAVLAKEEALTNSNRELESFAYAAAHDLQAPLRGMLGYLGLLEKRNAGKLDAKSEKYLGQAEASGRRMASLVDDLLAIGRLGAEARRLEPVDTHRVVATVIRDFREALEGGAEVQTDCLPWVLADENQLARVFQNLISNGLKFCEGVPKLAIRAAQDGQRWRFQVSDNGIGMEPKILAEAFQMFTRGHSSHSYEGTGLGLALVKKIVERHGGEIWIESEVGKGTTFFFTLEGVEPPAPGEPSAAAP